MDLKPENILLKSLERPVLKVAGRSIVLSLIGFNRHDDADFGVAQRIDKEGCRQVRGTLMYMAPEILNTNDPYDSRVDLWSIGVILYGTD